MMFNKVSIFLAIFLKWSCEITYNLKYRLNSLQLIIITGQKPTSELCQPLAQCWLSAGCKENSNNGFQTT